MSSEKNRSDLLDAILFNDVARARAVLNRKHSPDLNLPIALSNSTVRFRSKYDRAYRYSGRWDNPRIPNALPWWETSTHDLLQHCTTFLEFAICSTVQRTPIQSKLDRDAICYKIYDSYGERTEAERIRMVRLLVEGGENPHHGEAVAKARAYTDIQAFLEEVAIQPGGWDYREGQRRFYAALGTPKTDAELEALYLDSVATAEAAEAAEAAAAVAAKKAKAVKKTESSSMPSRTSARIKARESAEAVLLNSMNEIQLN